MVEEIDNSKIEIRSNILDVARTIFSKFGFKKTTLDDIAQAVNKGKSSLYYYFKSKDELFEAVVEKEADIMREKLNVIIESDLHSKEKIRQYAIVRMNTIKSLQNYYDAMKNNFYDNFEYIENIRKKYDLEEISIFKRLLDEGVRKNYFVIKEVEFTAIAIVTAMKGIEVPLFINNDNIDLEERIDGLLNILFYGIMNKQN